MVVGLFFNLTLRLKVLIIVLIVILLVVVVLVVLIVLVFILVVLLGLFLCHFSLGLLALLTDSNVPVGQNRATSSRLGGCLRVFIQLSADEISRRLPLLVLSHLVSAAARAQLVAADAA